MLSLNIIQDAKTCIENPTVDYWISKNRKHLVKALETVDDAMYMHTPESDSIITREVLMDFQRDARSYIKKDTKAYQQSYYLKNKVKILGRQKARREETKQSGQ